MDFEEAVSVVKESATPSTQRKMEWGQWDKVPLARKILAEEYIKISTSTTEVLAEKDAAIEVAVNAMPNLKWTTNSRYPERYTSTCGRYYVFDAGYDGFAMSVTDGECDYGYTYDGNAKEAADKHNRESITAILKGETL